MAKKKSLILLIVVVFVAVAALAVACNDDKVVKEITVEGGMKSVYAVGEAFAGGRITVTYEDGTSESIDITAEMLSGFDTSTPGTKQVTVTYEGVSVTVEIVVEAPASPAPEGSLELVEWQMIYLVGEALAGNLTIRTQSGELIPVTAAMISGFDTSTAGEKTVRITYNGLYIETVISVVAIPEGGDSEFAASEIDVEALLASLHRVTTHIGVPEAAVQAMDETVTENIVPFMEKAGVTNAQIDDIVNLFFARGNALADAIKGAANAESPEALFNAVFTDNVVDSVLDILDYIGSATAPEGLMNVTTYFITPLITPVVDFGSDELATTFFPGNLGDVDYDQYKYGRLNYDEIMDVADNSAYKDYFYEYYFGEGSVYNIIKEVLASASARLIAGNATELFEKIASYDRESIKALAEFLKEAMPVFIEGDIGSLFGAESKISIKDIVRQINFLGKFMNEAVLETVSGDDAVLAAAEIADTFIVTLSDGYYSIDVSSVEGVRAALRMVFGLMEELEDDFVLGLYSDYDDMVKADEAEYEVKYGTFTVQIANFIAEGYNKLSDYDKMALKSFADWLDEAPGVSLLSGIVELLDGWVIKDVDSYSDEELVEAGRKITDAVSNEGVSERTNSMEIYRGYSNLPEYIPVGTSSADGLFVIELSYYKENSGYWGTTYITVEEFKEAGGTVNAEFDFSSKGFKTVTVTLSDVDYTYTDHSSGYDDNGNLVWFEETYTIHFEGCTDSFEIYVYDDTSAADFEAVRGGYNLYAMVMEKNSSMENITASDMYFSTSYRHKETRNEIWARSDGFYGDWNISFEGIDTSRESGCLYLGKVILEHTVFGKAERPLFYCIYDPANSEESLTNIEYYSSVDNSYPMRSSGASIVALKGAEFEDLGIYARKKYAYLVNGGEELEVKYEGSFNSGTLGTQPIKLYVEGYEQYAITVNVIVIEPETAPDISIYLNNGDIVFPVGATKLEEASLVPDTEGEETHSNIRIYYTGYWDNGSYQSYYRCDYNTDLKTLTGAIEYIEKFGFEYKGIAEELDTATPTYYDYRYLTLKFEYNQQETTVRLFYYVKEIDATAA